MKRFVAYILSIILIFPCLFLFSACEGDKTLNGIAFFSDQTKLVENETFVYDYGEEINVLGSTLSVKAIYSDNSTKTLTSGEFSYTIIYSETGDFNNGTTIDTLPSSTSVGHFKIIANYKTCSATIFITINERIETEYFASLSKPNNEAIYFGDKLSSLSLTLNTSGGVADTTELNNLTYYIVDATTLANVPEEETNKAKYILETIEINHFALSELANLNSGDYYIFALFNYNNETIYSTITELSKFTICPRPIPVAEPTLTKTVFDGNSHNLTISNLDFYTVVSGSLTQTNAGTYTTVIKPKFENNYFIDWNLNYFDASIYNYYVNFETFATNATTGAITNLVANKETGEISITWQIDKATYSEGVCLSEYFYMRAGNEINTSIIPFSFDETFVYYRARLYSMVNKNLFFNSYVNNNLTLSLLNNNANALLIKDSLNNAGAAEINVDITNSIYVAVPLENYFDGMAINYKIVLPETKNYSKAEFNGELTLNNISANFTSTNIAVSAGTTLETILNLFSNLDGLNCVWYNVNDKNEPDLFSEVDITAPIVENVKYALFVTRTDESWGDEVLSPILDNILTENNEIFNFEVYAQENNLDDYTAYSYKKDNNSYKLSRFGKNIIYLTNSGESRYFKFVKSATNPNVGYYEIYSASENGASTTEKLGYFTQGQLSNFVNLFLTQFYANEGETSSII